MNNNSGFKTKTFLLLCMLIPLIGISQTKNLISTHRVFPKVDKVLEFKRRWLRMHKSIIRAMLTGVYLQSNQVRILEAFTSPKDQLVGRQKIRGVTLVRSTTLTGIKMWLSI